MASTQAAPGTVLITGTTSGVGLYATKALVDRGWQVITANRNPLRAEAAAVRLGLPSGRPRQLQHLFMDLGDLESVRTGANNINAGAQKESSYRYNSSDLPSLDPVRIFCL